MIQTDYRIEALAVLLAEDCLLARYFPLIPYKDALISGLLQRGIRTKCGAEALSDDDYRQIGLPDPALIGLFRRFLTLYDLKPQKAKELSRLSVDPEMLAAFRELYLLPGVKEVRAELYYRSGYRSLADFADAAPEEVLEKTARTIADDQLSCAVPLPKEVRTHIAVARAFTWR